MCVQNDQKNNVHNFQNTHVKIVRNHLPEGRDEGAVCYTGMVDPCCCCAFRS